MIWFHSQSSWDWAPVETSSGLIQVQLSCLNLVSRLLEQTDMPMRVKVKSLRVIWVRKTCHIHSFYMVCWKHAVSSCVKGFIWRPWQFVTLTRNVPINQKPMFCLFEVPGNFSDSSNPCLHMESLLKHKNWNRWRDTHMLILKKNLKHAFCSAQRTHRVPTENLLPAKRKPAHNQCMHSEIYCPLDVTRSLWS